MNFENKPLKSAKDIALKKNEQKIPLKSAGEVAEEKVKDISSEKMGIHENFDSDDWKNKEISVKRSSGDIEGGWFVRGNGESGVLVVKPEAEKFLQKVISYEDFFELNKKDSGNEKNDIKSEKEEKNQEDVEEKLSKVQNREELVVFLDSIDGLQGTQDYFTSKTLKNLCLDVLNNLKKINLDNKDETYKELGKITRTADLRNKIHQISVREKITSL